MEDRGPGAIVTWHIPPGAARAQEVEDPVEDASEVDAPRTSARLGRGEQRFEQGPFTIAEVTGIGGAGHETPERSSAMTTMSRPTPQHITLLVHPLLIPVQVGKGVVCWGREDR
jgi:hypothetical protein